MLSIVLAEANAKLTFAERDGVPGSPRVENLLAFRGYVSEREEQIDVFWSAPPPPPEHLTT